jgi:hypothetical protein
VDHVGRVRLVVGNTVDPLAGVPNQALQLLNADVLTAVGRRNKREKVLDQIP